MAARLWRTTQGWAQVLHLQSVGPPLRWGGMGFRHLLEVAPAAFLGSWAQVLPSVQQLDDGPPILGLYSHEHAFLKNLMIIVVIE